MFVEEVLRGLEQEPAHDPGGAKDHYRYMEVLPGPVPVGLGDRGPLQMCQQEVCKPRML